MRLQAAPGMLMEVQGGKSGSAGRHLVPGAGPDPGRFTCSLIMEGGGSGAGGEAACWDWPSLQASREVVGEAFFHLASQRGQGNVPVAPGSCPPLLGITAHRWGSRASLGYSRVCPDQAVPSAISLPPRCCSGGATAWVQ